MERVVLQSDERGLHAINNLIDKILEEKNIINYEGIIKQAVENAAKNAIQHGNQYDASKKIILEWGDFCGGIYFEVTDEGNGFDYSKYGALSSDPNVGIGIFMMKTLASHVEYKDSGRCVRMEFLISGIEKTDALRRECLLENFYAKKNVKA